MSIPNILKSTFVIGLGAILGYSSVKMFSQPSENNRQLASLTFSKLGSEQFAKTLFDIKIRNESVAILSTEISTVKVFVEAHKSFSAGLVYSWNLPDNVTLIEGDANGSFQDFTASQTKELVIKVKGYSKEAKNYISFTVKGVLDDKKIERDILVSSRPEDSFEYVVQENEKAKAVESKGFNKLAKPVVKSPIDLNKVSF